MPQDIASYLRSLQYSLIVVNTCRATEFHQTLFFSYTRWLLRRLPATKIKASRSRELDEEKAAACGGNDSCRGGVIEFAVAVNIART